MKNINYLLRKIGTAIDRPTHVVAADVIADPNSTREITPDDGPSPSERDLHCSPSDEGSIMCITISDSESEDGEIDNHLQESETQDVDWLAKCQQVANGQAIKTENYLN